MNESEVWEEAVNYWEGKREEAMVQVRECELAVLRYAGKLTLAQEEEARGSLTAD